MSIAMTYSSFPFAVRLIGFSEKETNDFDINFGLERRSKYSYFRLAEHNLQDPDLYIVNADELKALVTLSDLRPGDVRPALLVGSPDVTLPYMHMKRPLNWNGLFETLAKLVEKRADTLSRLEAAGMVAVPERRRRDRVDLDLTDPEEYRRMRRVLPENSGILIVDKNAKFRDYVASLLGRRNLPVAWTGDEAEAVKLCDAQNMAVVLINTSMPGVDPYFLCKAIKKESCLEKTTVIFMVSKLFTYDVKKAEYSGVAGFLNKPVSSRNLLEVLKKFFPSLSRL
jgi:CheY-like chemotaxis protein